MKKVLIIGAICVAIAIIVFVIVSNSKNNKQDELVMVTEAGFAPYEFYEGQDIVGVDVKIAQAIADELGKKLVIKDIDFDSLINEVKSGKADFAAAGLSITPERQEEVDFSIEYAVSKQVIVVKKDSSIKTPEDINGKKVAVQLGTVADIVLTDEYPEVEVIQHKKYLLAVEDVLSGKSDAIVLDSLPAKDIVQKNSDLIILEEELFTDSYGIAIQKGNTDLLETINKVLQKLIDEGKIDEYTIEYLEK